MNMDAPVQRRADQVLDVRVVLDLGDPRPMTLFMDNCHIPYMLLVLAWVDWLGLRDKVVFCPFQLIDVPVSELVLLCKHFNLFLLQHVPCYILGLFLLIKLF